MFSMLSILEAILIVIALSTDAFVSGFAYGANRIKIPLTSVFVINCICCSMLALSLFLGTFISEFLAPSVTHGICFLLLLFLGMSKIFDSAVKALIRRHERFERKLHFNMFQLGFILKVYANPEKADRDQSRVLTALEASYLAFALSLDSLAVGFSAGITHTYPLLVVILAWVSDMLSIILGAKLGHAISSKINLDLSWLSGVLLIFLAILKI